jgi:hypothetical protein
MRIKRLVILIAAIFLGLLVFAIAYPMVASGGAVAGY